MKIFQSIKRFFFPTFMDKCTSGRIKTSEAHNKADDFIYDWHKRGLNQSLSTYLGMTIAEYSVWMIHAEALYDIIEMRKMGIVFGEHPITNATMNYININHYPESLKHFVKKNIISDAYAKRFYTIRDKWYKHIQS